MKNIRNFCIIAHIDHGKSTLADRMLEITGTIPKEKMKEQFLDRMDIERERGITIKLQPVKMGWKGFELNLIDTPGHVDFTYEVSRSLQAVEGAVLVVDATQGVEAQTLSNIHLAIEQGLAIIPVVNKIDLPNAEPERVSQELVNTCGFREDEIIFASGKAGTNVDQILDAVIAKIPTPAGNQAFPLRALVFDSSYDPFKGVIAYVRIIDGKVRSEEKVKLMGSGAEAVLLEVGVFNPELNPMIQLSAGEIGYFATGLKDVSLCRVGDTATAVENLAKEALPGYRQIKSMVFAGLYPIDADQYPALRDALSKLKLSDASLIYEPETSEALGFGFRCGFLGLLHMEVVQERLEREFNLSLIASAPTVEYKVETTTGETLNVENPSKLPLPSLIRQISEPWIKATIITPERFMGPVLDLCNNKRGKTVNIQYLGDRVDLSLELPLAEVVLDFYDNLKSISSGYASFDYEFLEYRPTEAVKLEILVAKKPVDALSVIVVRSKADYLGRELVEKLKNAIPRQNFEVSIQATIGGKVVARADISAFRKDVLAKMSGGHRERKDKLLEAQKKGKKRMKMFGSVEIPQEAFLSVLKM
ncbi:MAG: translation elongation factor 4 [Patescibacteria group bacterium]|nr:translation elongation factor 4 [Patescibacteria group bacterium]